MERRDAGSVQYLLGRGTLGPGRKSSGRPWLEGCCLGVRCMAHGTLPAHAARAAAYNVYSIHVMLNM